MNALCRQDAPRRLRRRRHAPQPAQDLLHAARRRRSRLRSGRVQEDPRAFLPTPVVRENADGTLGFDYDRPHSIGRVRMFYGNFGMFVRALAYILANGPDGLRQTTEDAVLNANYIRKKLEGILRAALQDAVACTRSSSAIEAAGAERRQDRRHRQAPHRLRLPPLHRRRSR